MDKLTPELRILGASLLSMLVILLWVKFFAPKPPVMPQPKAAISAPQSPSSVSPPTNSGSTPPSAAQTPAANSGKPAAPVSVAPKAASDEHSTVVQNDLYRVEISNRGAVVKSW